MMYAVEYEITGYPGLRIRHWPDSAGTPRWYISKKMLPEDNRPLYNRGHRHWYWSPDNQWHLEDTLPFATAEAAYEHLLEQPRDVVMAMQRTA